jgi:DegV family protein with EDD domain
MTESRSARGIVYLDGKRLRTALVAACQAIFENQRHLDAINVFPVADGDTGTNMAATAAGILDCLQQNSPSGIDELSRLVAEAALTGAQGNSGVILAQYLNGLSEALSPFQRVTVGDFGGASLKACRVLYESLSDPCEGTILTVIRSWATEFCRLSSGSRDFSIVSAGALEAARVALAGTPALLSVLREAHVVDAGGQGFVNMLEGIDGLRDRALDEAALESGRVAARPASVRPTDHSVLASKYRYCAECIVDGDGFSRSRIMTGLRDYGDSLIVSGSERRLKIHVHTDNPGEVFGHLQRFGKVDNQKVDDMHAQVAASRLAGTKVAVVTDSSCDLPDPRSGTQQGINVVPARLSFGNESYIDKVTMDAADFYSKLTECPVPPTTSQPSPKDFERMYAFLGNYYPSVLSIHVSAALSGTLQGAETVSRQQSDCDIRVVDSKSITFALGLIVREVAEQVAAGADIDEAEAFACEIRSRVRLFVALDTMDFIIRGGRVGRIRGALANLLRKVPIMSMDDEGQVVKLAVSSKPRQFDRLYEIFFREAKQRGAYRFAVGHANSPDRAEDYASRIRRDFDTEDVFVTGVAATLGAHLGPGAAGIAYLGK